MRIPEVTSHLFLKYYLNITKMKLASKEKKWKRETNVLQMLSHLLKFLYHYEGYNNADFKGNVICVTFYNMKSNRKRSVISKNMAI